MGFVLLSPAHPASEPSHETPVEVVVEQPPAAADKPGEKDAKPPLPKAAEAKPPEAKAGEEKAAEEKATEAKAAEKKESEAKAAEAKATATETKAAEAKSAAETKSAETKPTQTGPAGQKSVEQKPAAPKRAERKQPMQSAASKAVAPHAPPQPSKFADGLDPRSRSQGGLQLPFDNGPEIFRAVAVPLPTEGGDEPTSYKMIVFGLLERAKQYPEAAHERGARGSAVVSFTIDETGALTNVSLVQSSGDADLDIESIALVARAAPFPKPPPDAQRAFAAEITFGLEQAE